MIYDERTPWQFVGSLISVLTEEYDTAVDCLFGDKEPVPMREVEKVHAKPLLDEAVALV